MAFSYPVPIAELIRVPERDPRSPPVDYETPSAQKTLGSMLRNQDEGAAATAAKSKFAQVGSGAYVVYKQPVAERPKSVIVGRIIENNVPQAMMKIQRHQGRWVLSRVKWTKTDEVDVIRYSLVIREVSLHRDGAITYSDLRAIDAGHWEMQVLKEDFLQESAEGSYFASIEGEMLAAMAAGPVDPGPSQGSQKLQDTKRKEHVFVCQPDFRIVNDLGVSSQLHCATR